MKKVLALILAATMTVGLTACGGGAAAPAASSAPAESAAEASSEAPAEAAPAAEAASENKPVHIQIGVTTQEDMEDPYYFTAALVKQYVEEHGDGSLTIEVLANSQLGAEREMFEGQQLGTVDMSVISNAVVSNFIPTCGILDLPFLFDSYAMAKDMLSGEIGQYVMDSYEGSGVKALGMAINGFRQLVTVGKGVYKPEDIKGMKIRCMENKIYLGTYQALGANPTPMAWSEVIPALQQGTVEGLDGGVSVFYSSGFGDILDYISLTNQFCAAITITISDSVWNSLSADQQALLQEACDHACKEELDFQEQNDAEKVDLIEEQGVTIIRDIDIASFREAIGDFYEEQKSTIGAENVDKILEAVANYQ